MLCKNICPPHKRHGGKVGTSPGNLGPAEPPWNLGTCQTSEMGLLCFVYFGISITKAGVYIKIYTKIDCLFQSKYMQSDVFDCHFF